MARLSGASARQGIHQAEMWAGFAWTRHEVAVEDAAGDGAQRTMFPRTVSLPACYGHAGAEAFTSLAPGASTLAEAVEPMFRAWRRAGLARGVLPGPEEAEGLLDALRLQLATARGAPDAALWQGMRGAEPRWVLDLAAFVEPSQDLASAALARAVAQAVTALELAGPHGATRAAAVVPANLAGALMAAGLPYAAPEGRAMAAAMLALVLGTAAEASAALARRLSPCPAWIERRAAALAALEAAFDRIPPGAPPSLASEAAAALDRGLAAARRHGLRQLGLVALSGPGPVERLLGVDSTGAEPVASIVRHEEGAMRRLTRTLVRPAQRAIAALGLAPEQERAVVAAIAGHGALVGAPEEAVAALLETGIDPVDLGRHLPGAVSLAHAAALADPDLVLPDAPWVDALERHAIGTGTAAEAPYLPVSARAALAAGASPAARAAMAEAVAPFLGLGLVAPARGVVRRPGQRAGARAAGQKLAQAS